MESSLPVQRQPGKVRSQVVKQTMLENLATIASAEENQDIVG